MSEQFPVTGTSGLIPSAPRMYLYQQYSDDDNIQAFVASFNSIVQNYVNQFSNPASMMMLGVYTSPVITGAFLDWVGQSVYGIPRPDNLVNKVGPGQYDSVPWDTTAWGTLNNNNSRITDDQYKRILTWFLYRGDGMQMSMSWVRRRVARFLYGLNGADIDVGLTTNVNLTLSAHVLTITIPNLPISVVFRDMIIRNILPLPFQLTYSVTIL